MAVDKSLFYDAPVFHALCHMDLACERVADAKTWEAAHGTLSMSLIWQSAALTLGTAALAGARLDIRFARPVREGDQLESGGRMEPTSRACYEVWVRNQDGVSVIAGTLQLAEQPDGDL